MKISGLSRYALSFVAAAMLAGCGGSQPPIGAPLSGPQANGTSAQPLTKSGYEVLYSFKQGTGDGQSPEGSLVYVNGKLYGATAYGGSQNAGVIFSLTRAGGSWRERILHNFGRGADGANPKADLSYDPADGRIYGTTSSGGTNNAGIVFSFTGCDCGKYTVLHNFRSGMDGAMPLGGMDVQGSVPRGTTAFGGSQNAGVIFSLTPLGGSWRERILHNFGRGADGAHPRADVTANPSIGGIYGATGSGGTNNAGVVFKFFGGDYKEYTVLHNFTGRDGKTPVAGLIVFPKAGYGTTEKGGRVGGGVVYKVQTNGAESVLHSFGTQYCCSDGSAPQASLTNPGCPMTANVVCKLYGTTSGASCCFGLHCGTIFSISTNVPVVYHVLRYFNGTQQPLGCNPKASMIWVGGTLYGTTANGGASNAGEVFAYAP